MRFASETGRSFYDLDSLPGCNQIVVSHGMYMKPEFRGLHLAAEEMKLRLDVMRNLGYDFALCTANMENQAQIITLEKCAWKPLQSIHNSASGNRLMLYGYFLP